MSSADFHVYYWAGIGVIANKYGIEVRRLSIGDQHGLNGEARLDPIGKWCSLDVGLNYFKAMQVENYVTTLLAGSAASYIRVQDQRSQIKRSFGEAGLESKFLREVWQCVQREPDRAVAIIAGSLGAYDDGDVEATTIRLWRRAVRIFRQQAQYEQLELLASELTRSRELNGDKIRDLLKR